MKRRGGNYERRLEQIYMKYLLPYDTLSHQERQEIMHRVKIAWNKKNQKLLDRAMNPLYRQKRMLGLMDSSDDEAEEEDTKFALKTAEDCILKGPLMQHTKTTDPIEEVYFAPPSWLDCLWKVFKEAQESCEPTMFSNEHLLYNIGCDKEPVLDIVKRALPLYDQMVREEVFNRQLLHERGLPIVQELLSAREQEPSSSYRVRPQEECDYCRACVVPVQEPGPSGMQFKKNYPDFIPNNDDCTNSSGSQTFIFDIRKIPNKKMPIAGSSSSRDKQVAVTEKPQENEGSKTKDVEMGNKQTAADSQLHNTPSKPNTTSSST
ncbi:hypothetical protein PYW08_004659 [Mythimna loreyi]|uniref:Uncharacterized protein n=1 Tax=Mythimna loreyi TaxID=667449 RepID=A0ACC2QRG8_9NEOP|nr:hypothetical protein PYW08_004659 [Mythimna loreyi]